MNKEILRLAVPNIISNLAIPMLSAVDTALMGHLESEVYIGAIGVGSAIFNFIYWGFGFMRMGTTGLTAQAFGEQNQSEISAILYRVGVLSVILGFALIALQFPLLKASLWFFDSSEEVSGLTAEYFNIRIWAAPATISIYAITGWFLGMQNARYPLILAVFVNVANIGFNLLFIKVFGMKSDGVALGTVIAQYLGLILGFGLLVGKYRKQLHSFKRKAVLKIDALKRFFAVNFDIFIRTLCLIFTFNFFIAESGNYGDSVLAANVILLQFMAFLSYGVDGFAVAAESLVGRFFGSAEQTKLNQSIKLSFMWALGFGLVFSLCFFFGGELLLHIFTDKQHIIQEASHFIKWIVVMCFVNTVAFVWDGVFIGLTASKAMRNTMIISTLGFFLFPYYALGNWLGPHSLWIAMLLFMSARSVSLSWIYWWKLRVTPKP